MKIIFFAYLLPILVAVFVNILFFIKKSLKVDILGNLSSRIFNVSILSFAYFGLTIGFFVGLSSSAILSAALPALLTFIGGILVYYFFNANNSASPTVHENQLLTMISLLCISIFLSFGAYLGIESRKEYEINQKGLEIDREVATKKLENELKKEIIQFEYDLNRTDTISFDALPELK